MSARTPGPAGAGNSQRALQELRFAWAVAAALLLVVLMVGFGALWLVLTSVPWVVGAVVLWHHRWGPLAASALAETISTRAVRTALVVLAAVAFLVAFVFSPSAMLLALVWATALTLPLAARGRTARLREGFVNAAVVCVAAAVALGAAEAALRTRWLGWKTGSPQEKEAWMLRRYDGLWRHNVFGFRSPYETIARQPGMKRIFAAGDSYTWGDKIAKSDSVWPARLERALARTYPGAGFQVINAGQRGWTTANEAELLRRLGWQFAPDLVVVQYTINDALPSGRDFHHAGDELVYPILQLVPSRFRTGAVGSSAVLAVLEDKLSFLVPARAFADTYEDGFLGWEQMKRALQEMGDSSRVRGTPVVFMIFPNLEPGEHTAENYPYAPIIKKVTAAATAAGLHVLDLTPILAAQGGNWRRWWATPYDGHPNRAAQALAANALAEYIARNGWLAASPEH